MYYKWVPVFENIWKWNLSKKSLENVNKDFGDLKETLVMDHIRKYFFKNSNVLFHAPYYKTEKPDFIFFQKNKIYGVELTSAFSCEQTKKGAEEVITKRNLDNLTPNDDSSKIRKSENIVKISENTDYSSFRTIIVDFNSKVSIENLCRNIINRLIRKINDCKKWNYDVNERNIWLTSSPNFQFIIEKGKETYNKDFSTTRYSNHQKITARYVRYKLLDAIRQNFEIVKFINTYVEMNNVKKYHSNIFVFLDYGFYDWQIKDNRRLYTELKNAVSFLKDIAPEPDWENMKYLIDFIDLSELLYENKKVFFSKMQKEKKFFEENCWIQEMSKRQRLTTRSLPQNTELNNFLEKEFEKKLTAITTYKLKR